MPTDESAELRLIDATRESRARLGKARCDEIASTKFLGSQRKFLLLDTHSLAQT